MSIPVRWSIFNSNDAVNSLQIGDKKYDVQVADDSSIVIVDSSGHELTFSELLGLGNAMNDDYQSIENELVRQAKNMFFEKGMIDDSIKNHSHLIVDFCKYITNEYPDLDVLEGKLKKFVSSVSEDFLYEYVSDAHSNAIENINNYRQSLLRRKYNIFGVQRTLEELIDGNYTLPNGISPDDEQKLYDFIAEEERNFNFKLLSAAGENIPNVKGVTNHTQIGSAFINIVVFSSFCQLLNEKISELRRNYRSVEEPAFIRMNGENLINKYPIISGRKKPSDFNSQSDYGQAKDQEWAMLLNESDEFRKDFRRVCEIEKKRQYILACIEKHKKLTNLLDEKWVEYVSSSSDDLAVPAGALPERRDKKLKDFEMLFGKFSEIIKIYVDKYKEIVAKKANYDQNIVSKKTVLSTLSGVLEHRYKELSRIEDSYNQELTYLVSRYSTIIGKASVLRTNEDNVFLNESSTKIAELQSKIGEIRVKRSQLGQSMLYVSMIMNDFLSQDTKDHMKPLDLDHIQNRPKKVFSTMPFVLNYEYPLHYLEVVFDDSIVKDIRERSRNPRLERLKERARLTNEKENEMMVARDTAMYDEDVPLDPKKAAARAAAIETNPVIQATKNSTVAGVFRGLAAKVAASKPLNGDLAITIKDALGDFKARRHARKQDAQEALKALENMNGRNRGF